MRAASGLFVPAGFLGPALAPGRARGAPEDDERRFVFIFCEGGWDVLALFAPLFDSGEVELETMAEPAEAHGIPYVAHPERPAVDTFFQTWGDLCCVLNGFEVQSVAHPVATAKLFTAEGAAVRDDWLATIAGHSAVERPAPLVVVSGPAYAREYVREVVRVGEAGQLPALVLGDVLEDQGVSPLDEAAAELVDAWVRARAELHAASAEPGAGARVAEAHALMLEREEELAALAPELSWTGGGALDVASQLETIVTSLASGLSRCATMAYRGVWSMGFDTHSANEVQGWHFQDLFGHLDTLMAALTSRAGPDGRPLVESTTVVVASEMAREPRFNVAEGRDHWTWGSALFMGSGVRGGRVVGAFDEGLGGRPLDLASGEASDSGSYVNSANLGATLLAMADLDPAPHTGGAEPISAIFEG